MMQSLSRSDLTSILHGEVAYYMTREFTDDEQFTADLRLLSDDITQIFLNVEERLGLKIARRLYLKVATVNDYVELMMLALSGDGAASGTLIPNRSWREIVSRIGRKISG